MKYEEGHAIRREAALVRHLIGSGVSALGRANYADRVGEYYTAFFALSIGIERLAKLIMIADYAISNNGRMPSQALLRKFGHNLSNLIDEASNLSAKHHLNLHFARPQSHICARVINCLDEFADARRGRYANLASLDDPEIHSEFEPIRKWWREVAEAILEIHYYGKNVQKRVEIGAAQVQVMLNDVAYVYHTDECGAEVQDVFSGSVRTGQTDVVQKYGRYYTLIIVRWLADIFSEISNIAFYRNGISQFFGSWEFLQTYTVKDRFLKSRKSWPLF